VITQFIYHRQEENAMKKAGIVGGLGPASTID
jgi:hypothetical protein